jgi:cell division protein FtsB
VRDIGARIQRYRLSRYGMGAGGLRRLRWIWPLLLLWLAYAGLLGEHSWFRIWRTGREDTRMKQELARTRAELDHVERGLRDPGARREMGEKTLRERSGFAKRDEIIYRIPSKDADSLPR